MKTQIVKISALILFGATLSLQACKKDEDTKNTATAPAGTAIITGKVTADLILNNGQKEGVAGINVTGSINTQDLVTNPVTGTTYARKTYVATTNSEGVYELIVDANVKAVTVAFNIPDNFSADQTLENGTTKRTVFTRAAAPAVPATIIVNNGQKIIQDAEYTYGVEATMGLAKFTGSVFFRSDLCKASPDSQLTPATAGTIIVATWVDDEGRDREIELKVDASGKIDLSVETQSASVLVTFKGRKVTASRKSLVGTDCETKTDYEYTHASTSQSASKHETTKLTDIVFE